MVLTAVQDLKSFSIFINVKVKSPCENNIILAWNIKVYYDNADVTDLWDSSLGVSHEPKQGALQLEDWFTVGQGKRTILSGVVYGHHKIADGHRISTSTVKNFQAEEDGSIYLVTQNSRYKLGKQLEVDNLDSCFGKETIHSKNI